MYLALFFASAISFGDKFENIKSIAAVRNCFLVAASVMYRGQLDNEFDQVMIGGGSVPGHLQRKLTLK